MLKLEKYTKEDLDNLFNTGVYKIICLSNSKIYVGSASSVKAPSRTKRGFYGRWSLHITNLCNNKHPNKHLQNAWNLYGEGNFTFEIIETTIPEEAESREIYWSKLLDSHNQSIGFNILKGNLSYKSNREISTRDKISKSLTGKPRPKGMNDHLEISVLQYDLEDNLIAEFKSITEATKHTPCMRQAIYKCCIGVYKTSNGFKWKYKNKTNPINKNSTHKKHIYKYDLQMNLLHEYNSITECSNDLKYCRSTIRCYLNSEYPLENSYYLKT